MCGIHGCQKPGIWEIKKKTDKTWSFEQKSLKYNLTQKIYHLDKSLLSSSKFVSFKNTFKVAL